MEIVKRFLLYFLTSYIFFAGLGRPRADAESDYEFYKKYGNSDKSWNSAVEAGFKAYDAQDCDGAMAHFQEAIRLQAQDALVYYKMALCTELKGNLYTALQYYQLAQEKLDTLQAVHPYQREIFENYGRALLKAGKKKEALPYLSRAAAVGTPSFELFYLVGSLYAENNDPNAALENFKKALAQDTTSADPKILSQVYYLVGKSYYEAKDLNQANAHLERAVQLDPENLQAQNLRGTVATTVQQQSMVNMLENLSDKTSGTATANTQAPGAPTTGTQPPPSSTATPATTPSTGNLPPAAAKLPPLTPPEGTAPVSPGTPGDPSNVMGPALPSSP